MGRNRNYKDKTDHYSPFTYTKDKWDEDHDDTINVKIDPAKKGQPEDQQQLRLEEKFYVLTAEASPKKLVKKGQSLLRDGITISRRLTTHRRRRRWNEW